MAEEHFRRGANRRGSIRDFALIEQLTEQVADRRTSAMDWRWKWRDDARQLVAKHAAKIEAVAYEIYDRGSLIGSEVIECIARSDGR
jgi:hypothetical protein